jgi:hypothetical protein
MQADPNDVARAVGRATFEAEAAIVSSRVARSAGRRLGLARPCKCFVAETLVWTPDGLVPIAELSAGDLVVARGDDGELIVRSIVDTYVLEDRPTLTVRLRSPETHETAEIEATAEHPFWVVGRGWTELKDIHPGEQLATRLEEELLVFESAEPTGRTAKVFNFQVEGDHNYFVSSLGVWAHNCGGTSLKRSLRKQLRTIETLAEKAGNSATSAALTRREIAKLADEFLGPESSIVQRGRQGELWLQSADGKRMVRMPTTKTSGHARTGTQANFHQRPNTRTSFFDQQISSNVHVNVR